MSIFISIMGWIATVATLLIGLAILAFIVLESYERITRWFYEKAHAAAYREIGQKIVIASWWFSEDTNTEKCLEIFGKRLAQERSSYSDPSDWREEWRKSKESSDA